MTVPPDLTKIVNRVIEKKRIFKEYNFGPLKDDALKTFFDLAQEYETLENFYRVAVCVIKEFFKLDCRLYLLFSEGTFDLVCDSLQGLYPSKTPALPHIRLDSQAYAAQGAWVIPIRGNLLLVDQLPFYAKDQVIGMLELFPEDQIPDQDKFFFEKYSNRLGYNLHIKIISWQNIHRIRFINSLVADIEHNVIIPNISLSLYLRRLRDKIKALKELECVCEIKVKGDCPHQPQAQEAFRNLVQEMEADYQTLDQHYRGVSLFIESLFRPSHFQKGQFVLRRRTCRVVSEIIKPQLDLFLDKLKERGIEIDVAMGVMPDEDLPLSVDKGLMAQVYANLFSNAVKYARTNYRGRKYMAYGRDLLKDYFGPGKDGVKFNVFTTGPHIPPPDVPYIFEEGYRGANVDGEVGTGRGLYFVRNVIETHGGEVGYEATPGGNNFYVVLPLVATPEGPLAATLAGSPGERL
ncbi:MAG: HAMP domain-containing histidine kinase [Deltaproteobacteria bacterium]|nr:HAMP domain-containing histidine kinase [Deltaproteobacteria bacterium]